MPRDTALQTPPSQPPGASPLARGRTVPGSQITMPSRARAGSTIEGTAPECSRIEAAGQVLHPDRDRRFRLHIPVEAHDPILVRIILADGRMMVLRVEIETP